MMSVYDSDVVVMYMLYIDELCDARRQCSDLIVVYMLYSDVLCDACHQCSNLLLVVDVLMLSKYDNMCLSSSRRCTYYVQIQCSCDVYAIMCICPLSME
jgi:hypothetical protein